MRPREVSRKCVSSQDHIWKQRDKLREEAWYLQSRKVLAAYSYHYGHESYSALRPTHPSFFYENQMLPASSCNRKQSNMDRWVFQRSVAYKILANVYKALGGVCRRHLEKDPTAAKPILILPTSPR